MKKETRNKLTKALTVAYTILGIFILFTIGLTEALLMWIYTIVYNMWASKAK